MTITSLDFLIKGGKDVVQENEGGNGENKRESGRRERKMGGKNVRKHGRRQ